MAEQAFSELTFEELEISDELKRAVADLGFEYMTPIQAQAIPVLLTGRDVIGQAQTGTGKTAAFGIPILQKIDPDNKNLQAVILCPTRELAVQAAGEIRNFTKYMHDVKLLPVYGGQDIMKQIRGLKGVQIIVGTPGRVMDHMRRHTIKMDDVSIVILDEADEMLDMGFREDMEVILGAVEHEHQTCLFSATMPQPILDMTDKYQKDPELIKITKKELTIDRIRQYYYPIKHEYKYLALTRLLKFHHYQKSIIFCNTKSMVDELSASLQKEGYTADGLHGDLTQAQRDSVMGRFRSGSVSILIATDIAARGIDVDDVEAVFNYDIPQESEYYVHRVGRTARAGKEGVAHTLCSSREFRKLRDIEQVCHTQMEERRIPGVAEIAEEQRQSVLRRVLSVLNEGNSDDLVPVIRTFCEENCISAEAFAAAFLKKEIGEITGDEDAEINLPQKKQDGRNGGRRSRDRDREGRGRRFSPDHDEKDRGRRTFRDRDGEDRDRSTFHDRSREDDGRRSFRDRDREDRGRRSFREESGTESRKTSFRDRIAKGMDRKREREPKRSFDDWVKEADQRNASLKWDGEMSWKDSFENWDGENSWNHSSEQRTAEPESGQNSRRPQESMRSRILRENSEERALRKERHRRGGAFGMDTFGESDRSNPSGTKKKDRKSDHFGKKKEHEERSRKKAAKDVRLNGSPKRKKRK